MTNDEALNVLTNATAILQATRVQHEQIAASLNVFAGLIQAEKLRAAKAVEPNQEEVKQEA